MISGRIALGGIGRPSTIFRKVVKAIVEVRSAVVDLVAFSVLAFLNG